MSKFSRPRTVASADGTPIAYWSLGNGPALVVVHGVASEHYGWRQFGTLLSDRFTVCLMDRRGRNASGDTLPYLPEREAEDVIAVAEAVGGAAVLGHSIAGPIVLEAALRSPAIRSLISYEGWMSEDGEVPADFLDEIEMLVDAGEYEAALTFGDPPEAVAEMRASPMWPSRVAAAHTIPRELRAWNAYRPDCDRLRDLQTPTLLLMGELTAAGYRAAAAELSDCLPNAVTAELRGQSHFAYRESPELLADTVADFVRTAVRTSTDHLH
jgi:pimeloyl-ACP methyl ester carboxylesterase